MTRKIRITTKSGDQGFSRLFSGEKVSKDNPRLEACGDMDELASLLGVTRCHARKKKIQEKILKIQRHLFLAASEVATTEAKLSRLPQRINQNFVNALEQDMESLAANIPDPKGFIVPGGTLSSAYLDYARAVARRCERRIAGLLKKKQIHNATLLIWFNRLSDYLYLMARCEEDKPILLKEIEI